MPCNLPLLAPVSVYLHDVDDILMQLGLNPDAYLGAHRRPLFCLSVMPLVPGYRPAHYCRPASHPSWLLPHWCPCWLDCAGEEVPVPAPAAELTGLFCPPGMLS